jgi:hypothetical protein
VIQRDTFCGSKSPQLVCICKYLTKCLEDFAALLEIVAGFLIILIFPWKLLRLKLRSSFIMKK